MATTQQTPVLAARDYLRFFGDAWTLVIVSALLDGTCRFNELQRKAGGISPVTLTNRLKMLEQQGMITRTAKLQDQLSVCYCMTEKGQAMRPVIEAINKYGQTHLRSK